MRAPATSAPATAASAGGDDDTPAPTRNGRTLGQFLRIGVGLVISVVLLVVAFRGQNPGEIWAAMQRFDARWLVPALACYAVGVLVRAARWAVLLRPLAPVSSRAVLPVLLAGYTANNVLPLRTGELVRAYLVGQRFGVRKTAALATIAVERLFDGLTMLGFILIAMTAISLTAELRQIALIATLIFVGVFAGLVVLVLGDRVRDRVIQLALGPLPLPVAARVERMAESFLGGLGVLRRKQDLAVVTLTSIIAWSCEAGMYWSVARGFGGELATALTVPATLLTTGVANIATLVPAAPGYVGTFHAGVTLVVAGALGVARTEALSYAIVVHAALWLPVTVIGAVAWARLQWGQRETAPTAPRSGIAGEGSAQ